MNFVPNTEKDKKEMMDFLGILSISELFNDIHDDIKLKDGVMLPKPLWELEITQHMKNLSLQNFDVHKGSSFLGAGAYDHFIPSAVAHLISRSEFNTSYTPYQAEMSQGMLQSIFEFQSMICELCKMDVANASMYDGASAMAEAAIMASKYSDKRNIAVSKAVHPEYRQVLSTYANAFGLDIDFIEAGSGVTEIDDLDSKITDSTACVIVQSPNFFGDIEDLKKIGDIVHEKNSIFIAGVLEPISLGLLKPPGTLGADVVVGEAQALGNPLNFGGPHLGFMATSAEFLKKIPGRISGLTVDTTGESGFILTLQAREQHVRRERATSNICTNQALNALSATIYMALMGKQGLSKVAEICAQRAHYASGRLAEIDGLKMRFNAPFFNEFVIESTIPPKELNKMLLKKKIIGGYELGTYFEELDSCLLFCVTEKNTKEDIDNLVSELKGVLL
jgi:glycine dehydrogenase subunit 1